MIFLCLLVSFNICFFQNTATVFSDTYRNESFSEPNTETKDYKTTTDKIITPDYVIEFVKKYPETYPMIEYYEEFYNDPNYFTRTIDISYDLATDNVPLFIQWDKRWAYLKYGKETVIATSGCGPTCLAMVYNYFKKDKNINPKTVCDFSFSNNYYVENLGTKATLITEGSKKLGLDCKSISISLESMKKTLDDGNIIIALVKSGHFTSGGHFIVIRNYDDMNNFYINDPNSIDNSKRAWHYSIFLNESRNLWAISIA